MEGGQAGRRGGGGRGERARGRGGGSQDAGAGDVTAAAPLSMATCGRRAAWAHRGGSGGGGGGAGEREACGLEDERCRQAAPRSSLTFMSNRRAGGHGEIGGMRVGARGRRTSIMPVKVLRGAHESASDRGECADVWAMGGMGRTI